MRHVEPHVFLIAKTAPDQPEMRNWLDFIGAKEFALPPAEAATIGNLLVTLAGKRCYMSYQPGLNPNVSKVRTDLAAFIDNILKVGHGSVIEHVNYTFAIENVSRVFTAEFNRHRAGLAVSEGSMRYIRFDDLAYWIPESIRDSEDDSPELREAKQKTRIVFNKAFSQMEENYQALLDIWNYESLQKFKEKKKLTSLFRRLIGMGVATGGVWTGNLRALRHIFTMRCAPAAEEEICYVASMMLERMIEAEPDVFADFHKEDGYWKPRYLKI
ncbi:FAD-dependent thymidylate synthase [Anaerolineales bacterium HSG24]|nr:FAD-dependent thymidylate synthase [Anaerolineales bacterium HSG24]